MLELLDFPVRAEIRSLSPFVYKAEALLALCGCDYRKEAVADLAAAPWQGARAQGRRSRHP
ncbi:MAG: hypothetical protein HPM95_17150 [Alphaproteobacteria bacterium]|nr:hypothetical protein [Alphaproteobacteria bacterium]